MSSSSSQAVQERRCLLPRHAALFPFTVDSLLQRLESRTLLRAVLAECLLQHLPNLRLDGLDGSLWGVSSAVDRLETVPGPDLKQLVADLELFGDVYRVERLVAAEGPDNPVQFECVSLYPITAERVWSVLGNSCGDCFGDTVVAAVSNEPPGSLKGRCQHDAEQLG